MARTYKEQPRAYKVSHPNGFWAIVAADDDYVARNLFCQEYHYKDNMLNSLKTEMLAKDFPVKTPFFNDKTTIKYVLNTIKFFPRVISDIHD